ncbi:acyl-CoA synthetase family protein [Parachitinimonas caeni]|uniref:Acyl-CoA synthetase family protein n=1 Tax=Parachitinimonas caeni TaxID=3031301 RepID=A0ABT7DXX7_9NEIS|nr:acyl-CoA synthetase family protein [Parachitinimonas caeni]MDK2124924.1 acyl-CoA synthetase family protein [Parachitinimonas caeni]
MSDFLPLDRLLNQRRPDHFVIATRADQAIHFDQFEQLISAWHTAFLQSPGQRFAMYFADSIDFAAALLAAWHAGKCVYLPGDNLPATCQRLATGVDAFVGDFPVAETLQAASVASITEHLPTWATLDRQAEALVVYTSGSSGEPSAIPKKLSQLFDEVEALASLFDPTVGESQILATVSHQHIYGLLFHILWPLASGRPFSAQRLAFPEDIAAALASHQQCVLIASPAHLKRLPDNLPWATGKSHVRAVFSSGGPLPAEALPECRQLLGQAPIEIYGSSETGGIAWRQRQVDGATQWQPLPNVEFAITDDMLSVNSPHLADTGWFQTSDRVRATPDGFELLGRADRIVKIEEKRVSLSALEQALQASGWVDEARVCLLPGHRTVLAVAAVPSPQAWALHDAEGKRSLNQTLRRILAAEVESSVLPRRWRYVWALPQNSQGKVRDNAIQALFDPRRPSARLLHQENELVRLQLDISAGLPYFDGHFPIAPILPGVAQIELAILFGRELFPLPGSFLGMEAIKFQQVIPPGTKVTLELAFKPDRGMLTFKLQSDQGSHASGRILFGDRT